APREPEAFRLRRHTPLCRALEAAGGRPRIDETRLFPARATTPEASRLQLVAPRRWAPGSGADAESVSRRLSCGFPRDRAVRDIPVIFPPRGAAARAASSHPGLAALVHPGIEPRDRVVEGPDVESEVRAPFAMANEHVENSLAASGKPLEETRRTDLRFDGPPKIATQPFDHRRPEAHLGTVDDVVGKEPPHRFFQQRLRNSSVDLDSHRQVHGELDQLVIEEGNARLDRYRHSNLVHAHEEQLREPQLEFGIDHPSQEVTARGLFIQPVEEGT